jgi:phenylalanyl-tRNA synthetase beta subunit
MERGTHANTALDAGVLPVCTYRALATVQPVKIKNSETVHVYAHQQRIFVDLEQRTRYIVRRLNLVTVRASTVALTRPQHVSARLMRFLVRLSWIPIPSRMRGRR